MWFDAQARLAEIEACSAATLATTATKSIETQASVAEVASVAGSEGQNPEKWESGNQSHSASVTRFPKRRPVPRQEIAAHLPTAPSTCTHCGKSDWTVALTDVHGNNLHVDCWKAQEAQNKRKPK